MVAVQRTVPSGLQEMVTLLLTMVKQVSQVLPGVLVLVGVSGMGVLLGVSVPVGVNVLVGVDVLVGVLVGVSVGGGAVMLIT